MARKIHETLEGEVIRATEKAVLLRHEDGSEVWIPRSVCVDGEAIEKGDTDVVVSTWWLEQEGLA